MSALTMLHRVSAIAGLTAISGFASAGLVTLEFDNGDSLSNWTTDRQAPAGFEIINNELKMTIDGDDYPASSAFYDTQGMKLNIGQSNYLSVDMYVDSSWTNSERFAGLWGVGYDSTNTISAYPILEFQGADATASPADAGIVGWDYMLGQWIHPPSNLFNYDAFNNLKFIITSSGVEYYLNDNLVNIAPDFDTEYFGEVILNAKNDGNDYMVRYDNLTYGNVAVPEPGTLALLGLGLAGLIGRRRRM